MYTLRYTSYVLVAVYIYLYVYGRLEEAGWWPVSQTSRGSWLVACVPDALRQLVGRLCLRKLDGGPCPRRLEEADALRKLVGGLCPRRLEEASWWPVSQTSRGSWLVAYVPDALRKLVGVLCPRRQEESGSDA
ncbi:hypothetical protein BgiBS90_015450 [Biomphalaria glabrata]|nr:hypothetical protein BgiBS90_015450 [Biomphalaria glabrata]